MKQTRAVDQKYKLLREAARYKMWEAKREIEARYRARIAELVAERQAEIDLLPDMPVPEVNRHREDWTQRYCVTCGGAFLLATIRNARLLRRVEHLRRGESDSDDGWYSKLAGMRNPRKKFCCYPCQVGRADKHNAPCCLLSELEADLKEIKALRKEQVDREAVVAGAIQ
jgi:hypothetical protein